MGRVHLGLRMRCEELRLSSEKRLLRLNKSSGWRNCVWEERIRGWERVGVRVRERERGKERVCVSV